MFNVTVVLSISTGEWEYDDGVKHCRSALFHKKIELPFAPFPGLELTNEGWLPGRIERVSFSVRAGSFVCYTPDDDKIPDELEEMGNENRSRTEIIKWQVKQLKFAKEFYTKTCGWDLEERRDQMYEEWVIRLRSIIGA